MSQFDQPDPSAGPAGPQHAPGVPVNALPPRELSGVRVPMLIAGIFNCMIALSWFSSTFLFCCSGLFGIPLLVLGIFEIITFTKLGESRAAQDTNREKARTFAILDICTILLLNVPSMVCGIIQLANHRQFDE